MTIVALRHSTALTFAGTSPKKRAKTTQPTPSALVRLHKLDKSDVPKLRVQLGLMPHVPEKTVLQAYTARVRTLLREHLGLGPQSSDLAIHAALLTQYQHLDPIELTHALKKSNPAFTAQIMAPYKEPEVSLKKPSTSPPLAPSEGQKNPQDALLH